MTYMPLVSVIMPAYNAEKYIKKTLISVLSQTYQNIEVLVVDDGSQDKTAAIVEHFTQQDNRVFLIRQSNRGVAYARNLAIEKAQGEYIAPIDADDIWYPQKIEKQVDCLLSAGKSVGLVYAWSVCIDENDVIIPVYDLENHLLWHSLEGKVYPALVYSNFIGNASVPLIRRVCFDKVGGYNYKFQQQNAQGCEDWDLYLRVAEYYDFRVVKDFLVGYRQLNGSMSCNYTAMAKSYSLIVAECQTKHPEIPSYIYNLSTSRFYIYLAFKSGDCSNNWNTLVLLFKAINLDYSLLFESWLYKSLLIFTLKVVMQPLTSLFWTDYKSWKKFKTKLKSVKNIFNQPIKNQIQFKKTINLCKKIKLKRWSKVLQLCQQFEYQ